MTKADLSGNDYADELLISPTDGSAPARRLTRGDQDGMPSFSPDGRWLAFVRPGSNGRAQIHLLPMDGGEAFQVTDQPLGTGMAVWSPDSTRIAYTARAPEPGRYSGPPGLESPRRIDRLIYYVDGFGHTGDRPRQIFVTDPFSDGCPATRVTKGDYDNWDVSWSPAGDLLAFVSARHENRNNDARTDIWVCAPDGGEARPLTHGGMYLFLSRFAPDGEKVCFCGSELDAGGHSNALRTYGVWTVPIDQPGKRRRLTDDRFHLSFASQLIVPASDGIYFAADNRGAVDLILVPYDGGEPEVIIAGQRQVNGYAVTEDGDGTAIAAVVASGESAGDLLAWRKGEERMLTSFGSQVRDRAGLRPVEPITATAPDGYVLHGWVARPAGPGPHPVILQIKGGPFTQFGYTLAGPAAFDEAQVYAAAGYAVVLGNPRGCAGYGQAHASYVEGELPRRSAIDLFALLDAALEDPSLDRDRVGVMGGSFGGYMAAWMSAHHPERFRAAIGERGLYAIDSYLGTSDDGVEVVIGIYGPDRTQWAWQNPINYADQMKLPMLIIHSEEDRHCPLEQAQRLFVELKLRGIEVELLLFPGEGHDMSRTGLPSHRIARFEAILAWWRRHLGATAGNP
ncbi:MAG TPA: S9 family peptidase [Streptosporangiaceae bacterium]|nr:S9 family peptidase [Streptosporangiaceae bacterium]